MQVEARRERLASARLYFVCDAGRPPEALDELLEAALRGGADLIQLRDKAAPERSVRLAASLFREAAARHGALFILNDDPALAAEVGADGVHVGQDDAGVVAARVAMPPGSLVGLSTHAPDQLAAAEQAEGPARPDYVSIGPVWETPTKPGRPAAGLDYVEHAAAKTTLPWFAIGGIEPGNLARVRAAGARRAVVVRAIRDAEDPERVSAELAAGLGAATETER
jgi:thiamine-phosphate pyrophosphorylase